MKSLITLGFIILSACATTKSQPNQKTNAPAAAPAAPAAETASANDSGTASTKPAKKSHAKTAKADSSDGSTVTCTSGSDTRTLAISDKDGGCALDYTKEGKSSTIATSHSGKDHCSEVEKKIQDKLATAGFSCQ